MASESGRFANLMEEDLQQIIDNKDLWGEIFMRYSKTNTTWFTSRSSENSWSLSVGYLRLLPFASRREVVSSIQHLGTSNFYYFPQSKMEYASSAWIGATPTSLAQLDSIQNRAKRVTGLPSNKYEDHRIQPLSHRRAIGAATLFYRMFYKEAPELLCQLMPDIHVHDPRLRRSLRSHGLVMEVPRPNLISHARSFLPSTAQLWILFLPKFQQLDQGLASVGKLITFWVLLRQQLLNDFFASAVNAQLCHVVKKKKKNTMLYLYNT